MQALRCTFKRRGAPLWAGQDQRVGLNTPCPWDCLSANRYQQWFREAPNRTAPVPCQILDGAPLTPELLALEELLTFEVSVVLALSASPAAIPGQHYPQACSAESAPPPVVLSSMRRR